MNYTTLFPNLLKSIPNIPQDAFCYNYNSKVNYNKKNVNMKAYIPNGKRQLLWFTKSSSNLYCILLETHNSKVTSCHFKYVSFENILTSGVGTLIWVTQVGRELSLNKIIYYKGQICKLRTVEEHMIELKYMLNNYINNINHSSFLQMKLPSMSTSKNFLLTAVNLEYTSYSAIEMSTNFTQHLHNYFANFIVTCVDKRSDIYNLSCKDENGQVVYYENALINNKFNSILIKKLLNIAYIPHEDVEYSDSENDDKHNEETSEKSALISCIFSTIHMKWVPYKLCDKKSQLSTLSYIKRKREKSLRSLG